MPDIKYLRVGIIGCGTIGSEIARACRKELAGRVRLAAVCDADADKARAIAKEAGRGCRALDLASLIRSVDLAVEAASSKISADIVNRCVSARKAVLVMSVGGLIGREGLLRQADARGVKVFIPSGAICGIDGLKSASQGRIRSVRLTTKKPPKGLAGAPYLIANNIDIGRIRKETVIFEGPAIEAVKGFPQNVNVAAVLSMAGIGAKKTIVRIMTSPSYTTNVHEIEIESEAGRIFTRTENVPSRNNPRTSALAFMSAVASLRGAASTVRLGT